MSLGSENDSKIHTGLEYTSKRLVVIGHVVSDNKTLAWTTTTIQANITKHCQQDALEWSGVGTFGSLNCCVLAISRRDLALRAVHVCNNALMSNFKTGVLSHTKNNCHFVANQVRQACIWRICFACEENGILQVQLR
jgi:hypothetical protein